jgi:eukaryotic-like serine/threonine-protein kinase
MNDASPLPPGTLLAGKFRIERLLGAGAMGAVYAIDHELTHNKRALKLLHPALRNVPDLVRRFLNEASAAGRAGNPHLVETFDAGTLPTGEPYLVMELLVGEPLDSILKRETKLEAGVAAEIVAQAAEGMDAAHRAGIIHRDLKPENLFVTTRDGAPFVKILDFGVSKFLVASADQLRQTRAGMVYGSPAYMSPEQLSASPDLDPRADVFALGVVLYQSLAGILPFDGPTLEALALSVLGGEPRPLRELRPELPQSLVDVVLGALAPLRDNRLPTANALARALSPFRAPGSWSTAAELGHAATIASNPPVASAGPMVAPPSLPPGVPRPRRAAVPIVAGVVTILLAIATAMALTRSRAPAGPASFGPPPAPTSPPTVVLTPLAPPAPALAVTLVPANDSPSPSISLHPNAGETRKVAPPPPSAASSASGRPTPAHNLGLSEDNPFR